jgi:hypothetical protein
MGYFISVLLGVAVVEILSTTLFIVWVRLAPQAARTALEWLILHTLPDSKVVAVIRPRRAPSHINDNRILVNDTNVWVNDNGAFYQATIEGYHREPRRGNYYLVKFAIHIDQNQMAGPRWMWVPDTYVWETIRELRKAA